MHIKNIIIVNLLCISTVFAQNGCDESNDGNINCSSSSKLDLSIASTYTNDYKNTQLSDGANPYLDSSRYTSWGYGSDWKRGHESVSLSQPLADDYKKSLEEKTKAASDTGLWCFFTIYSCY